MEDPLRIYNLKRRTMPKIAVLATGLAAAVLLVTINPIAAQAFPNKGTGCTGCHTAGGSVTATPSKVSVAPSAAYTVALAFTGGSTPVGYAITGNGANVNASNAGPASMTAPAAAGSYTYTVWMRSGVVATTTYTITVGAVATTPPPTTVPPTTVPPTTLPPTTVPPTSAAPILVGDNLSPTSAIGMSHLSMYNLKGANCAACHSGKFAPPTIMGDHIDMKPGKACATCHSKRSDKDNKGIVFISLMNDPTKVVYNRCSDCHTIANSGGDDVRDE